MSIGSEVKVSCGVYRRISVLKRKVVVLGKVRGYVLGMVRETTCAQNSDVGK